MFIYCAGHNTDYKLEYAAQGIRCFAHGAMGLGLRFCRAGTRGRGHFARKRHHKIAKLWLAVHSIWGRFAKMKCSVDFQKEKIENYMYAAQSGVSHWIQCKGHRCFGVLDANGEWRCFVTGKKIDAVVKVHCD
jgi:hypothetical protein